GARGNSGVIISQMLRGFAHHLRHRRTIDTFTLATAMRESVAAARAALLKPVEGTIVSVAQAAADAAYMLALHEPDFYRLANGVLRAANDALERTPEQLPILKEAGVVDAGGAGFCYFLEGVLRFLPDVRIPATAFPRRPVKHGVFTAAQVVGENKFCTEFILEDADCETHALRDALQPRGDSLIVAGGKPRLKVHIHTDKPDAVTTIAARHGTVTRLKVDNMEQQHNVLVVDKPQIAYSLIAVVPGLGFDAIVKELGAEVTVIAPGNPSVRDLLLAVNKCLSPAVFLFANDPNVQLAAAEVAKLTDKSLTILPTRDIVGGIAGLFAFRSAGATAPSVADVMQAAARPKSALVFFAGKDAKIGGTSVSGGKPAATCAGALYGGASIPEVLRNVLQAMGADGGGLITLYYGGAQKEKDAQHCSNGLRALFPQAEVEYYYGGQRSAEFVVSLDE
ncbi:MAG: DAK2 domain-containing protein, partial [Candidatus Eremiobacteraeota bacterium]|nr:DAK2 domain-containing protein [Candidatus Eremiobacteraeota bacterium]